MSPQPWREIDAHECWYFQCTICVSSILFVILIADTGEDFDYGDYDNAETKSVSSHRSSYRDYDEYHYGYKPQKKKVYVPVFVTEKEKKKSKHFLYASEVSVCSVHLTQYPEKTIVTSDNFNKLKHIFTIFITHYL